MGRFALAAKDLQIKKLADNIRFGNQSQQRKVDDILGNNKYETGDEYVGRSISSHSLVSHYTSLRNVRLVIKVGGV